MFANSSPTDLVYFLNLVFQHDPSSAITKMHIFISADYAIIRGHIKPFVCVCVI